MNYPQGFKPSEFFKNIRRQVKKYPNEPETKEVIEEIRKWEELFTVEVKALTRKGYIRLINRTISRINDKTLPIDFMHLSALIFYARKKRAPVDEFIELINTSEYVYSEFILQLRKIKADWPNFEKETGIIFASKNKEAD